MTKRQFLILLVTSLTLVILTGINGYLQFHNQKLASNAQILQNYINQSHQIDTPFQNLVMRMAGDSDKEPRLKDILAKRGVKATLNVDGQEKQYP